MSLSRTPRLWYCAAIAAAREDRRPRAFELQVPTSPVAIPDLAEQHRASVAEPGPALDALVVGDRVVASMRRTAQGDEFRSNVHRGGSVEAVSLDPIYERTAVRAAQTMGLNVAGVDLLRSNHGPVIMEVNSSPGLEGIETATGKDVAGMVIEFIERNARPGHTRTRGKG